MKNILRLVIILCSFASNAIAQCVDQFLTTAPTVNSWDWRGTPATPTTPANTNWQIRYINTSGQITPLSIKSPFFDTRNENTFPIAFLAEKDYQPTDGWELIAKNVGTLDTTDDDEPSNSPYVILYNKNTARLRVFLLIVQLFSEVGSAGKYQPGGFITVQLKDDQGIPYQSNLLTTNTSPMLPLDKFERNLNMVMVNSFTSATPYWLYTDVPVAYDPCTCLNKGILLIKGSINLGANINLEIHSVPQTSPIDANGNTNDKGFLKGFSALSNSANASKFIKGGFEVGKTSEDNISKLQESITNLVGLDLEASKKTKLDADLKSIKDAIGGGLGWLKLVPEAGAAVSSIVSLIDYFTSGGDSSPGASPSGVVIMNDFKATGTITSEAQKTSVAVALPGSDQSLLDNSLKPIYNNTLGIFNLLRTPEVSKGQFNNPKVVISNSYVLCGLTEPYMMSVYDYKYTSDVYFKLQPNVLNEAISYVVNPAINADMELSDIKVAIQIAGIEKSEGGNMISETKTKVTLANGTVATTDLYRTEYYPIGQADGLVAHVKAVTRERQELEDYSVDFCNLRSNDYVFSPQVTIKIVARIKRKNTTKPEEDIIFIATYPVKYRQTPMAQRPSISNPDLSDIVLRGSIDMARGFNGLYGYPDFIMIRQKNIFLENGRIFAGVGGTPFGPYPLSILTQAYSITMTNNNPNDELVIETTAGDIVFEAKNTAYQAPVSPANVFAFCNTDYKNNNTRNTASAKTVETQAETPKDTPVASPKSTQLLSIYPNPTTGEATITYEVDKEGSSVSIYLTNNLGIRVMEVSNEVSQAQGTHNVRIDTRNLSAGVYFYTLVLNGVAHTERLVVIK